MDMKYLVEASITMEFMSMIVYQELANTVLDDSARNVLRYLARGEETHIATLVEIFSAHGSDTVEVLMEVDIIQSHRREAQMKLEKAMEKWGVSANSPAETILDFAQDAERYAHNHYLDLARKTSDRELAAIFKNLAKEEKDHEVNIIRLKDLLKTV